MAIELVSFDELKIVLGLSESKSESDYPDLTIIQESVVAMFENHTGRTFKKTNHSEDYFIFSKSKMIPLKGLPVISIESITLDGDVVDADAYDSRPYGVELANATSSITAKVSYSGGLSSVPEDLKRAAMLQTIYEYQNKHSIGLEVVSTGGGTVTKPQLGMLKEVGRLLNKYVHPFPSF